MKQTILTNNNIAKVSADSQAYPEQDLALLDIAQMVVEQNGYKVTEKAIDDIERLFQYECLVCGYTEIPRNIIKTLVEVLCKNKSRLNK